MDKVTSNMTSETFTWMVENSSTLAPTNFTYRRPYLDVFDPHGKIRIPLYTLIFLLSIIGNSLVILTLIRNRRMRTVTNVFLLNLSISDLLLAVFCMPFTLIPQLMRNFVFGEVMCKSIRYAQGKLEKDTEIVVGFFYCMLFANWILELKKLVKHLKLSSKKIKNLYWA